MQHAPDVTLPRSAADALALWQDGKPVPAFRVASEGASQLDIWTLAFAMLDARNIGLGVKFPLPANPRLSAAESKIALEITKAAIGHGYARMLQINLAGGGEPIFVQKPRAINDDANPSMLT